MMPPKKLNVIQNLQAIEEAATTGNVRKTARKWKVYPSAIRKWRSKYQQNKEEAGKSARKLTLHPATKSEHRHLESQVYSWIIEQKDADLAACTTDTVDRVFSLNPRFKSMNQLKLTKWIYRLLKPHRLYIRICTHVSQVTDGAMQTARQDYCRRRMTSYSNQISDPHCLPSMDEKEIYLICFQKRSVDVTGRKTSRS